MKVSVVCVLLLFLTYSTARISIEMDPEDLDQISDFFQAFITHQQQHQYQSIMNFSIRYRITPFLKKTACGFIQLIGVMLTLVGANLLTSKLDSVEPLQPTEMNVRNNNSQMCNIDYGCNQNLCWRTCYTSLHEKINSQLWCYTSPKHNAREFQRCIYSSDCSPRWECLESCHT